MNLNKVYVVDIEADGLLDEVTKLHVLSVGYKNSTGGWSIKSTNRLEDIKKIFENPENTVVGHFFLMYDKRVLEKLYPTIDFKATIVCSLAISQYLYEDRLKHGLEDWGVEFGYEKVKISEDEWKNLSYEKAVERCERDVLINCLLWDKMKTYLWELYGDWKAIEFTIKRLNFKMQLMRIQDENRIDVDVELCKKNYAYLQSIIEEKSEALSKIMPKVPVTVKRQRPKNLYKIDGTLSQEGEKWQRLTKGCNLSLDYDGEILETIGYKEPNCQSNAQVKNYLLSLGWKPKLFKDGANGKVPQIRDDNKELCKSVLKLVEKVPELEALAGLSVAQHRAGYLKAFLDTMDSNNRVTASWSGIAKTLRVKHVKPIVNLPSNTSAHGDLVRKCLIAPPGKIFVNADLSSLEDKTKQCCIYPYDPEYVETLNTPGYDAHLNIAQLGNFMSAEEVAFYKWYGNKDLSNIPKGYESMSEEGWTKEYKRLSVIRKSSKVTNYSATYSASPRKIAEAAGISLKEGTALHTAYWELNWSVKNFTEDLKTKVVDGKEWIYNPYTHLWLRLTSDHIKFSACNQNFGACVFDTFLWFLIQEGVRPIMTVHDELSFYIDEGQEDWARKVVKESMDKVNAVFKQPIKFESTPEFAKSYGDVH